MKGQSESGFGRFEDGAFYGKLTKYLVMLALRMSGRNFKDEVKTNAGYADLWIDGVGYVEITISVRPETEFVNKVLGMSRGSPVLALVATGSQAAYASRFGNAPNVEVLDFWKLLAKLERIAGKTIQSETIREIFGDASLLGSHFGAFMLENWRVRFLGVSSQAASIAPKVDATELAKSVKKVPHQRSLVGRGKESTKKGFRWASDVGGLRRVLEIVEGILNSLNTEAPGSAIYSSEVIGRLARHLRENFPKLAGLSDEELRDRVTNMNAWILATWTSAESPSSKRRIEEPDWLKNFKIRWSRVEAKRKGEGRWAYVKVPE